MVSAENTKFKCFSLLLFATELIFETGANDAGRRMIIVKMNLV